MLHPAGRRQPLGLPHIIIAESLPLSFLLTPHFYPDPRRMNTDKEGVPVREEVRDSGDEGYGGAYIKTNVEVDGGIPGEVAAKGKIAMIWVGGSGERVFHLGGVKRAEIEEEFDIIKARILSILSPILAVEYASILTRVWGASGLAIVGIFLVAGKTFLDCDTFNPLKDMEEIIAIIASGYAPASIADYYIG